MADRIEWNRKQNVEFVHNLVNTILKRMLYNNRIVEGRSGQIGVITYRLPTCFCLHQSLT